MNFNFAISIALLVQIPPPQAKMVPQIPKNALGGAVPAANLTFVSPTSAILVTLNFKDKTAGQIVSSLNQQTGGLVELLGMATANAGEAKYTLESTTPVPLWDAIDRFSALTHFQRTMTGSGPFNNARPHIQFHAQPISTIDYGPAVYLGPFRLGPVTVHEVFDRVFLKSKAIASGSASALDTFYAEIPLLAEPDLMVHQVAPLHHLEAIDDLGQSLVDPQLKDTNSALESVVDTSTTSRLIRFPLKRPGKPSSKIAKLGGVVSLEMARIPRAPTSTINLENSVGKTIHDGEIAITINEYRLSELNQTVLKMTLKPREDLTNKDQRTRLLRQSRIWSIFHNEIRFVNAQGQNLALSGATGSSTDGSLVMNYTYSPYPQGTKGNPPTQVHIFHPNLVKWDLAFEFKDLPLP